jgi:hypothetical protein
VKRLLAVLVVVVGSISLPVVLAGPAGAAVHTAADFAADCNADGTVTFGGGTEVFTGGTAVLTRPCSVNSTAATLVWFHDLTITGDSTLVMSPIGRSIIVVTNATFDTGKGDLQFTPGGTRGDPGVGNDNAVSYVTGSTLRGASVEVGASVGGALGGTVYLVNSTVESTVPMPAFPLRFGVRIDAGGSSRIVVGLAHLRSAQGIKIDTFGGASSALVLYNTFDPGIGTSVVHVPAGGSCTSAVNSPAVPCT